jgi:hypothetical protein
MCLADGNSYKCACANGYRMHYTNELQTSGICVGE